MVKARPGTTLIFHEGPSLEDPCGRQREKTFAEVSTDARVQRCRTERRGEREDQRGKHKTRLGKEEEREGPLIIKASLDVLVEILGLFACFEILWQ